MVEVKDSERKPTWQTTEQGMRDSKLNFPHQEHIRLSCRTIAFLTTFTWDYKSFKQDSIISENNFINDCRVRIEGEGEAKRTDGLQRREEKKEATVRLVPKACFTTHHHDRKMSSLRSTPFQMLLPYTCNKRLVQMHPEP